MLTIAGNICHFYILLDVFYALFTQRVLSFNQSIKLFPSLIMAQKKGPGQILKP
jgi:hypothetical protein